MIKAMILAAGRGERMRPLTDTMPKPLVKVGEYSLIERHLFALAKVAVQDVVINIHHLAHAIIEALGNGEKYGIKIHYSYEKELLDTGGGILKALPILGNEPFLLISADIITNYPLQNLLIAAEKPQVPLAHLVMVPNPVFHPQGDFGLDHQNYLVFDEPRLTYANLAVINPKLFQGSSYSRFGLGALFRQFIPSRQLTGELFQGEWQNIGCLEQLQAYQPNS